MLAFDASMILKVKDSMDGHLEELDKALQGRLSDTDRKNLEKERALLLAGLAGEKEAAYHIDFHLRDNSSWAVIHDLRIESKGRAAQIDHVLIDRVLEVYVVESKNFRTKVRCANGGWERLNRTYWEGIPSPVEQNERHIAVLKDLIGELKCVPTRLGVPMPLEYFNSVLVNPSCSIIGSFPKHVRIHKMDTFVREIKAEDPSMLSTFKLVSSKTLEEFAYKLVEQHKPAAVPEKIKAKVAPARELLTPALDKTAETKTSLACTSCSGPVTSSEAYFCRINKARFGGAVLCRNCQSFAPAEAKKKVTAPVKGCFECGTEVDSKVAAFCRFNSKRFGGRILCRNCQPAE